jgi:hypothetical protein
MRIILFPNVRSFRHIDGGNLYGDKLKLVGSEKIAPIRIFRFFLYEFIFLQINEKESRFWIKTGPNEEVKFPPGKYAFRIEIVSNVYGKFKLKNNELVSEISCKSVFQEKYILVEYRGLNRICSKLINRNEYDENIWYKSFSPIGFINMQ